MATPELRPLGVGEILDVAIKVCLRHAATLAKVVLVVVVPVQALGVLITASTTPEGAQFRLEDFFSGQPSATPAEPTDESDLAALLGGQLAVALLSFLTLTLATAACFKAVSEGYLGEVPNWRASLRFALRRFLPLLWLAILTVLLLIPAFIALIVPGIWLAVRWIVSQPALLTEDLRGRKALGRSFQLVRGRWWPTVGAVLVGYMLAAVLASVLQLILLGAFSITGADDELVGLIATGLAGVAGGLVSTPFQAAVIALIYFDLRVRKEGFDLEVLARGVGVERSSEAQPLARTGPDPYAPGAASAEPPTQRGEEGQPERPPYWPPPPGWRPSGNPPRGTAD